APRRPPSHAPTGSGGRPSTPPSSWGSSHPCQPISGTSVPSRIDSWGVVWQEWGQMAPGPNDRSVVLSKKFPDFVPPTKIHYSGDGARLHLRRCKIVMEDENGRETEHAFEKGEIRIGAMDDNDLCVRDDT